MQHRPSPSIVALMIMCTVGIVLFSDTAGAQCTVTCMGATGAGKTCKGFVTNGACPDSDVVVSISNVTIANSMFATCQPSAGPVLLTAMHTPGAPATASCSFKFNVNCVPPGGGGLKRASVLTKETCVIATSDGLPVELMDFSID